ncbi:hypothetical protein EGH21_23730 [Halomicroarcula sp. F13]|uniref:Uncharacterized protein n=1 Tax=Haloarcula rubra TaxID=2487747 RepID=A0AAW4PXZ9_9EURY|nr:hypothetical protein [Halomicroarcula rubra]MBX0326027.1 hypothetical protein [Halomicroarcula rubra]
MRRRKYLRRFGTLSVVGLAGCGFQAVEPTTETGEVGNGDKIPIYHWLSEVENFDEFEDKRESDNVRIEVGVDNGGEPVGFGPPAIIITPASVFS